MLNARRSLFWKCDAWFFLWKQYESSIINSDNVFSIDRATFLKLEDQTYNRLNITTYAINIEGSHINKLSALSNLTTAMFLIYRLMSICPALKRVHILHTYPYIVYPGNVWLHNNTVCTQ